MILHESNAFPGKAVKIAANKVNTILISFEEARARIPKANNIVLTGTPTKIRNLKLTKEEKHKILKENGLENNKPVVLIFGGSQGAKAINDEVVKIINKKLNNDYQIVWAPGPIQYDIIKKEIKDFSKLENVKIFPYIYDMEKLMNACDLVISRSGAMTITEISIVGKPAIFIPLPNVSNNHQEYNAKVLQNVGAAKIILNKDLTATRLNKEIEEIISNEDTMIKMGENAKKVAPHDVLDKIYEEISKLVK